MRDAEAYEIPSHLIEAMAVIYGHESESFNETMDIGVDFSVSWTKEEYDRLMQLNEIDSNVGDELFEHLIVSKRLVPLPGEETTSYRTDTAELVRLSTFNYPRFVASDSMIEPTQSGATWGLEKKHTPKWDRTRGEMLEEFERELRDGWHDNQGQHHTYSHPNLMKAIEIVLIAYDLVQRERFGTDGHLSGFQFRSLRSTVRGMYADGPSTLAIVAGTGSGKSYGFQLGTLIGLVEKRLSGSLDSVHSIYLYPRVALMDDQRRSLEPILNAINLQLGAQDHETIRWLTDGGSAISEAEYKRIVDSNPTGHVNVKRAIRDIYGDPQHTPHLVFANPDTITNRLFNKTSARALTHQLSSLVFDEVHLLESITGANSVSVLRRLLAQVDRSVMTIGSSATIADPQEHLSKVFGVMRNTVQVESPRHDETELTGLIHHVLHKGLDGSNFKTNFTNLTSLVSHVRRRRGTESETLPAKVHKTLGFADSLDLLGSWEYMVRDNEGLELTRTMRHHLNNGQPASQLKPQSSPLPYRFNRPLVHLAETLEVEFAEPQDIVQHCNNCVAGVDHSLQISNGDVLGEILMDHFRRSGSEYVYRPYEFGDPPETIGITCGCPFFNHGLCWREEVPFNPIELVPNGPKIYSNSMYPIRLTSDSIGRKKQDVEGDAKLEHFKVKKAEFFEVRQNSGLAGDLVANIALSSPAIEVGMDFDNAYDAILFKAIRNISAYRQKVGRLGRERFRDVYAAMLTSFRAIDFHYYRNPIPLLNNEHLSPIPLGVDNENSILQTCYLATIDHVVRNGPGQSQHLFAISGCQRYTPVLDDVLLFLNNPGLAGELSARFSPTYLEPFKKAIAELKAQLSMLTEDLSPFFQDGFGTCLADRIGHSEGIVGETQLRRRKGLHRLQLSREGIAFVESSKSIHGALSDLVVASHLNPGTDDLLSQLLEEAKEVWSHISKGEIYPFGELMRQAQQIPTMLQSVGAIMKLTLPLTELYSQIQQLNAKPVCQAKIAQGQIPLGLSLGDWQAEAAKMDWRPNQQSNRPTYSIHYLDDLFTNLSITRHRLPFVFQEALFISPNETYVDVFVPQRAHDTEDDDTSSQNTVQVPIGEVLMNYLPGNWTYRKGPSPLKSKCYESLEPSLHPGLMLLPLGDPPGTPAHIKHKFMKTGVISETELPWGFQSFSQALVGAFLYAPVQLNLKFAGNLNLQRGNKVRRSTIDDAWTVIKDNDDVPLGLLPHGDDEEENGDDTEEDGSLINIPESYPLRWQTVRPRSPQSVQPYTGPLPVDFESDAFATMLFDEILYDSRANVSEFVLGQTRRYQGNLQLEVQYISDNTERVPAAIGHDFLTTGLKFNLNRDAISNAITFAMDAMTRPTAHGTRKQLLQHTLATLFNISRFTCSQIIQLVLFKREHEVPATLEAWINAINELTFSDYDEFVVAWGDGALRHLDVRAVKKFIVSRIDHGNITMDEVNAAVVDWATKTFGNSLAIHMLQAAREFTGCRDEDLGYHVAIQEEQISIWIYDRAVDGNGSCETLAKWMQIPQMVREHMETEAQGRILPSRDFFQTLTDYVQPCASHQSTIIASAFAKKGLDLSYLHHPSKPEISYLVKNYDAFWSSLRNEHNVDFHAYPISMLSLALWQNDRSQYDRMTKAMSACHTSCVECLEEFNISNLGPLNGPLYANKRLLDSVFRAGMAAHPNAFRQNELSLDGMSENLRDLGFQILDQTITTSEGTTLRSMIHPERLWAVCDEDEPISEDGRLNMHSWAKMNIRGWTQRS